MCAASCDLDRQMTACVSKFGATFSCAAVRGTLLPITRSKRIKARGQFSRPALDCLCISFARSHLRSTFRRSLCRTSETITVSSSYLRSFVVGIPLIAEYPISLPLTTLFLFRLRLAHRHSPSSQNFVLAARHVTAVPQISLFCHPEGINVSNFHGCFPRD